MSSDPPYSKPAFSTDTEPLPTATLYDRVWWAGSIGGSMALVATLFIWTGFTEGVSSLIGIGVLCAVFSVLAGVRGIDAFAELRGRKLLEQAD